VSNSFFIIQQSLDFVKQKSKKDSQNLNFFEKERKYLHLAI